MHIAAPTTSLISAKKGIACNKLLAKLVSGVHKPDDQTILPPPEAWVRRTR
jgi:nucleotidyltransferase/DNA polymerase involved in DNA repair